MSRQFKPSIIPSGEESQAAWWFIFKNYRMLVGNNKNETFVPSSPGNAPFGLPILRSQYLGSLDGTDCYSAEVPEPCDAPEGMIFQGLRQLHGYLEEDLYSVAFRAVHIMDWDRAHLFCGRCGSQTRKREDMRAKECPKCGFIMFPRLSPAVIVLVEREGRVLLARANRFQGQLYSVLAGFVEPGETLEEAVHREIREEVGIEVKDIRYFGSQPWPFPDSLMIAFTANYAGGEIRIDEEEILDAEWFEPGSLPEIPGKISVARQLIDWFVDKKSRT